jgi:putative flippase GtrA
MQIRNQTFISRLIRQIGQFGIVGLAATASDLVVYNLLVAFGLSTPISKALSFITGLVVSYLGNSRITFKAKNKRLRRFLITYTIALVINVSINEFCLNIFFKDKTYALTISWLVATAFSALFNFSLLKCWVFR